MRLSCSSDAGEFADANEANLNNFCGCDALNLITYSHERFNFTPFATVTRRSQASGPRQNERAGALLGFPYIVKLDVTTSVFSLWRCFASLVTVCLFPALLLCFSCAGVSLRLPPFVAFQRFSTFHLEIASFTSETTEQMLFATTVVLSTTTILFFVFLIFVSCNSAAHQRQSCFI